jgi:hypothetical protein
MFATIDASAVLDWRNVSVAPKAIDLAKCRQASAGRRL